MISTRRIYNEIQYLYDTDNLIKFLDNFEMDFYQDASPLYERFVQTGFDWSDSKEGDGYWLKVYDDIKNVMSADGFE